MMPGTRLLQFARRCFPSSTVSSVFEPLVADWQRQWNDATPAQRRWINARGIAAFATTTAMMTPRLALGSLAAGSSGLLFAGGFWLVTSSLLTALFLFQKTPPRHLWLLLPGSLTVMLPFAILPAIDGLRRNGGAPTSSQRMAVFALAILACIGVTVGQGWLTPAANQRWRNLTASELVGRPVVASRGVREITTSELIAGDAANTPTLPGVWRLRELNLRLSLALLPAVLVWLRWLAGGRPRRWPVARSLLIATVTAVTCISLMAVARPLELVFFAPGFGPLLALALFTFTARTGIWLRQRGLQIRQA